VEPSFPEWEKAATAAADVSREQGDGAAVFGRWRKRQGFGFGRGGGPVTVNTYN